MGCASPIDRGVSEVIPLAEKCDVRLVGPIHIKGQLSATMPAWLVQWPSGLGIRLVIWRPRFLAEPHFSPISLVV